MSNSSHRRLEAVLEAVLLFHSIGDWNATETDGQSKANKWQYLIGEATENRIVPTEATTKVLCDAIRDVLEIRQLAQH